MPNAADPIIRRIHRQAVEGGDDPAEVVDLARYGRHPRWALSDRDLTFDCGCVARRFRTLTNPLPSDPVIFRGLPEQAVYHRPCRTHEARVNDYVRFAGFVDFAQWRAARWYHLTGERP